MAKGYAGLICNGLEGRIKSLSVTSRAYAKLILILIKQLVDVSFEQSYLTKESQKPLYKTRYMLDELGNLQSEGHGIAGFQTMLSIGLGQDQQFTLILQTLQQLKDVYGESVDKIVQGNVSNIVFLKSTDDSMIQTLSTMSGQTHKTYRDSKTTTQDLEKLALQAEGKISYTWNTRQVPVIEYTDLAYISERNSIVFRAGDPVIWNRNETILPMSWRLFSDTIKVPGKDYSLQTVPTLSTVLDFDVRKNVPDFMKMFEKRLKQASMAPKFMKAYKEVYGYTDYAIAQLDPDVYAEEIMAEINADIQNEEDQKRYAGNMTPEQIAMMESEAYDEYEYAEEGNGGEPLEGYVVSENKDTTRVSAELQNEERLFAQGRYAGGILARKDLLVKNDRVLPDGSLERIRKGNLNSSVIPEILEAYLETEGYFKKDRRFRVQDDNSLYLGAKAFVLKNTEFEHELKEMADAAKESGSRVYAEDTAAPENANASCRYRVTADFLEWLASLESWEDIASGEFERAMKKRMAP